MKRCLLAIMLLVYTSHSFAQNTDSIRQLKQVYLLKSRRLNSAGSYLLAGGIVLPSGSALIALGNASNKQARTIMTIGVIGATTAILASIVMLAKADVYKKKGKALSFGMQPTQSLLPKSKVSVSFQPALTFRLSLAKQKRMD